MSDKKNIDSISVYNAEGKEVDKLQIDKAVFGEEPNYALIHQAVLMYQANRRQGTARTKSRDEVSGGGVKPWRQKGTGRARVGDNRTPIWRKGGIVFGPKPRDFNYSLPKAMRKNALISGISAKIKDKKVFVLDEIKIGEPKTKAFKQILDKLNLKKKTLFVADSPSENIKLASRNLKNLTLRNAEDFNVLDVLINDDILFTRKSFEELGKRLKEK